MTGVILALGVAVASLAGADEIEPEHARNPVYRSIRADGWTVAGAKVTFPAPSLTDDASAEDERAALRKITGSERAIRDFTRDSVSAPFILKTHDQKTEGGVVRQADLWFIVRARLDELDPDRADAAKKEPTVEAGNMRFTLKELSEADRRPRGIDLESGSSREWYAHLTGRLLDRIHAEATDRATASRAENSWVFASRTESKFDDDREFPNRWWPITRKGSHEEKGKAQTYPGGASYVKISRLASVPGALLVEAHFAFFEPRAWFDGAPILRSKIGVVAQDRIRDLRRELAKSRKRDASRSAQRPRGG